LKRGMEGERMVKSGYLLKKGEKRKVSGRGVGNVMRGSRGADGRDSSSEGAELEEAMVCASNGKVGLLSGRKGETPAGSASQL
jgi:hypothetical protein